METKTIISNNCYLTTPKHRHSFVGKWFYIYSEKKGFLSLTTDSLIYKSDKSHYVIPLESIKDISIGHFSRIAKPIKLNYISIKYHLLGEDKELLFTPTESWCTTVWKTNKFVAQWFEAIKQESEKRKRI